MNEYIGKNKALDKRIKEQSEIDFIETKNNCVFMLHFTPGGEKNITVKTAGSVVVIKVKISPAEMFIIKDEKDLFNIINYY